MSREAWLLIRGVDSSLWTHRIQTSGQVLGRAAECDIPLAHSTVSRRHAEVWKRGDQLFIRDLGSRNGTFVDGERVVESPFEIGNAIQVGQVVLDVVASPDAGGPDAAPDLDSTLDGTKQRIAMEEEALPEGLSAGQRQVLQLLLRGLTEKQVASSLCLSPHTIHTHVKRIYKLLGVRSRGALMAKFMKKTQEFRI